MITALTKTFSVSSSASPACGSAARGAINNRPHLCISVTANDSGLPDYRGSPLLFAWYEIAVCGRSDRVEDMDTLEIFFDYI